MTASVMAETTEIVMYSSPFCGYCSAAKRLLDGKNVEYTEIDVLFDAGKREEMRARSGRNTVPQIFIGETHVGGYDDLSALDRTGELDPLLERVRGTQKPKGD